MDFYFRWEQVLYLSYVTSGQGLADTVWPLVCEYDLILHIVSQHRF